MSDIILSSEQTRNADSQTVKTLGVQLGDLVMSAAKALRQSLTENGEVVILAGNGNNGADGYALSVLLKEDAVPVTVIALGSGRFSEQAAEMRRRAEESGVKIIPFTDEAETILARAAYIIDSVFGTGFRAGKQPDSVVVKAMAAANKSRATRIACDIPSGCCCDTGTCESFTFRANMTVTFAAYKPCFFLYPAKNYCGQVTVAEIAIPEQIISSQKPQNRLITADTVDRILKPRQPNTHKGSFGTLKMICGSKNMTGAAYLAATAALRSGVGLVCIAADRKTRRILQTKLAEPVFTKVKDGSRKASAVLVGCGLSAKKSHHVKYALKLKLPTVIDADALTYMAQHKNIIQRAQSPLILTPHPAEMARLCKCPVEQIESDRFGYARMFAVENRVTVVLKGHHTLIALPDGRIYVNTTGNSGLAKGGSGDVLAGIIASLLAQGYTAEESAVAGVWLHGKAADLLKEKISEYGLLPSDIPLQVAEILKDKNLPE